MITLNQFSSVQLYPMLAHSHWMNIGAVLSSSLRVLTCLVGFHNEWWLTVVNDPYY